MTYNEFFGKLDVVINNAGMSAFGKLEDADPLVIRQVIDSNVIGSLMMSRFSIPELKKTKGNILFVGSLVAIHGLGRNSLYSSAKKAYVGIAESLKRNFKCMAFLWVLIIWVLPKTIRLNVPTIQREI